MAALAPPTPNPHLLLLHPEPWHREHQLFHPPAGGGGGGCTSVSVQGGGGPFVLGRRRTRRAAEVRAFWQDVSRPSSIEMEAIAGLEELDEALRRSRELSQPIIIDWMATWCRKCIYLKPKLEKLAAEYYPRIKFYYVDVNKVPQTLVKRANISGLI